MLYVQESGESKVMATADMPDKNQDSVRLVCISDTHGRHGDVDVPAGDILCFAGDMLLINRYFTITNLSFDSEVLTRQSLCHIHVHMHASTTHSHASFSIQSERQ